MIRTGILLAGVLLAVAARGDGARRNFERTVDALAVGQAAERNGATARMRQAARDLQVAGATPADNSEDLTRRWHAGNAPTALYRDRALGPAYRTVSVPPGGTARFQQTFLAGRQARVAVVAVHRSSFDLSVSDDETTVCSGSAAGSCDWVPLWTTRFNLMLKNTGSPAGTYYLVAQ